MSAPAGLQFTATIGNLPPDLFAVVGFQWHEGLSELFSGTLALASFDPGIAVEDVLEQPLVLRIWQDGERLRRFHGVVAEFARGDTGHRRTRYELVVAPALWRLGLMHNSRIFQGQSSGAIIQTLLEERGITGTIFDFKRPPEEREYCVQHRESDLALLARLAAEEGWHYRFEVGEGGHPLVLADHHRDAPRLEAVPHNARAGGSARQGAVFRFRYTERVRAAEVALKDYTFTNPAYALMHEHSAGNIDHQRPDYQHYDYPGRFKTDARGKAFTRARLEALRNDASEARGASNRPDFLAGARVALTGHDAGALNRDWLLTRITHVGHQPQALEEEGGGEPTTYHNDFCAIPADRPWRPTPPPRPVMDGPQVALVTGPEGEEIHCDEHGRVKVRFPWDRYARNDEHASTWLRVSQGWAGGQYGFMAIPRIGHEVIVSFLDGDPDQPLITGRTYHATNTPPYPLPRHKTRTTLKTQTHKGEGSNELRFEDEADQQQIYVHAQKDLDLLTEHNRTEVIHNDSHLTVERHRKTHIRGDDHHTVAGEKREQVGKDQSLTVSGSHHGRQGKAQLVEAGSEIHHHGGVQVVLEAGAEVTLKAGGSFIRVDAGGVVVSGPSVKMNSGGGPGAGSGVSVRTPELPAELAPEITGASEPAALAMVEKRPTVSPRPSPISTLRTIALAGKTTGKQCGQQTDGSCTFEPCACREEA